MALKLKLISENPDVFDNFEIVEEQSSLKDQSTLYVKGPYIGCNFKNKNGRWYDFEDTKKDVNRYIQEMVLPGRALGELNHPSSSEVNLERACHMVVELKESPDSCYYGKSKLLTTPMGTLLRSLINDGVKIGMSTRALGSLEEDVDKGNVVKNMYLVAIDAVADPSYPKAFVNGVLESKSWVVNKNGDFEEIYEDFEKKISKLPKKEVNDFLREQIIRFIKNLR